VPCYVIEFLDPSPDFRQKGLAFSRLPADRLMHGQSLGQPVTNENALEA